METFENEQLLEPLLLYKNQLKDSFHANAEEYFEELTKKSETDVEKNQELCRQYYAEERTIASLRKQKGGKATLKGLSIAGIILFAIAAVILIVIGATNPNFLLTGILSGVGCLAFVGLFIFFVVKLSKIIKNLDSIIGEHEKKAKDLLDAAYETMARLNSLYDWNMAASLFTKTTPLIKLDPVFDPAKYQYLHEKYGYNEYSGTDISSVYVQSGSILGNPFVFEKNYVQSMRDHTYEGTLVITYTVRVSDGKGGSYLQSRTQTLVAHYTAPEPFYYLDTWLIYGNDAAPNLSFSRQPTNINTMNEKQIERYVKNFDKNLDKKVEKDLKKGNFSSFTRMANEEFEALFNALDRNNETEFRLLFTPLAQKNLINLLKGKDVGFGDDFIFQKEKTLNYVKSSHMQGSDSLNRSPESFEHFDYKVAKDNFLTYSDKYLKDVYFDLAPLISVPLYQQHKSLDYIYERGFNRATTNAEVESAANSFAKNLFAHPATRSAGVILKSIFKKKVDEKTDEVSISAHSFEGIDRVALVPVLGGDGKMHNVPVKWIEYKPISQVTPFVIMDTNEGKEQFSQEYKDGKFNKFIDNYGHSSAILYKKRLMSFIPKK